MRRIVLVGMSTLSGLVMLFSYHTSTNASAAVATGTTGTTGTGTTGTTSSAGSSSAGSSSGTATGSTATGSTASGTYTGDAVQTRWGIVQVQITVENGTITASEAVQYPNENPKDQQINAYAVPQLNSEAVAQQTSSIDAVSGATVTSNGYIQSLQSAIDQAHL